MKKAHKTKPQKPRPEETELCCVVESDPCGKPYKLVIGKLRKRTPIPGIDTPGRVEFIIKGLFFTHQLKDSMI